MVDRQMECLLPQLWGGEAVQEGGVCVQGWAQSDNGELPGEEEAKGGEKVQDPKVLSRVVCL